MKSKFGKRGLLFTSVASGLAGAVGFAGPALAQGSSNEVIVTGTFIAGTAETAALPVDVIGADELERQGNPTLVDMIKNLSVSTGIIGDQNQYASNGQSPQTAGTATVNLRGLGPQRTLVLLNGKRLALHPTRNGPVDINTLPQAAIGRVEVLKDGAAATYGSDAIGGVVNFITRKGFSGLQLSGETRYVPDAENPDYTASVLYGWTGDRGDILVSGGWQYRGRLRANAKEFNDRPFWGNPDAGFSFTNNPTSFQPLVGGTYNAPTAANPAGTWTGGTVSAQIRDPGCMTVGAVATVTAGAQTCAARIAGAAVNTIDPSKRFQLYGETNYDISDNVKFHAEALFAQTFVVQRSSPAYPSTLNTPSNVTTPIGSSATGAFTAGSIIGSYFTPATNPGLALLMTQFPAAFPAGTTGVRWASGLNFRALGLGGNPIRTPKGSGQTARFRRASPTHGA